MPRNLDRLADAAVGLMIVGAVTLMLSILIGGCL
jgi:hypothetical protein